MSAQNHAELVTALSLIGVTLVPEGSDCPVFEDDYMKFMMAPEGQRTGEENDRIACDQFVAWLTARGATYERHRERAVRSIDPETVRAIEALWGIDEGGEPIEGFTFSRPWAAPVVRETGPAGKRVLSSMIRR